MADLPTNYLDDILAQSMNGKRKYRITRADGTFEEVTLEDVSEYEQVGSNFGAGDINKTNQAVNEKFDSGDVVDPMLTTEPGFAADAYQTKLQFDAQNKNFEWKKVNAMTDVPTSANEICVCVRATLTTNVVVRNSVIIPYSELKSEAYHSAIMGFYATASLFGHVDLDVTLDTATVAPFYTYNSASIGGIYYR